MNKSWPKNVSSRLSFVPTFHDIISFHRSDTQPNWNIISEKKKNKRLWHDSWTIKRVSLLNPIKMLIYLIIISMELMPLRAQSKFIKSHSSKIPFLIEKTYELWNSISCEQWASVCHSIYLHYDSFKPHDCTLEQIRIHKVSINCSLYVTVWLWVFAGAMSLLLKW